jgi:hypothetical protein
VRVDLRQLGVGREEPEILLALQDPGPDLLVALVESALVPVRPLQGHEMRRVPACGAKCMKNGLSGSMTLASWMN